MKLQLDTTLKTIKVEGTVNLNELYITLEKMLPNGLWREFSLESGVVLIWSNPVPVYPFYPYFPWWSGPYVTYGAGYQISTGDVKITDGNTTYSLVNGVYNVEI